MNVTFDRLLDAPPPAFPVLPDVIAAPPPGRIIGIGSAGWVVDHAINNSYTLTNRLLRAGLPVFWLKDGLETDGAMLAPGAVWIPASARAKEIVEATVGPLGLDAYAMAAKPDGATIAIKPLKIGLVDIYGGSMASGWTRWIFEQYEFPYELVYPQALDKGGLAGKYDVLIFQSDVLGSDGGPPRTQPDAKTIPPQYRRMLLGQRLAARTFDRQMTKIKVRAAILNRFSQIGTPNTIRVA